MNIKDATYLLETEWIRRGVNPEFATITIESPRIGTKYEPQFENLVDPDCPEQMKNQLLAKLLTLAESQNKGFERPKLVRLWRIANSLSLLLQGARPKQYIFGHQQELNFKLSLICEFDEENHPITHRKEAVATPEIIARCNNFMRSLDFRRIEFQDGDILIGYTEGGEPFEEQEYAFNSGSSLAFLSLRDFLREKMFYNYSQMLSE